MQKVTLSIDGMTCGHCVQHVRGALAAVPGVGVRRVRIGAAQVTLDTPAAVEAALAAVQDAGYEAAVDVTTVVLDKTGTVTEERPTVTDIVLSSRRDAVARTADELLSLVASLETSSEHPLADAIVRFARERRVAVATPETFASHTGQGATGVVDGFALAVGNAGLMRAWGRDPSSEPAADGASLSSVADRLAGEGKTPIHVAIHGALAGVIAVADRVKPTSRAAIDRLRAMGPEVVMLTGDNRRTAEAVARAAGIDRVVAVEAADIALMRGDLLGVVRAVERSRRTMRTMKQNLFWAFAYDVIGIPVAAGVLHPLVGLLLSPILASAAMAFSSVSVVSNSLRLRRARTA